jgi:uncharacterized protein with ATP-grasp and redox domains
MKTYLDCMACFVVQSLRTARMLTKDEKIQEKVLRKIMKASADFDMHTPPPVMSQQIYRIVQDAVGVPDPYLDAKKRFNEFALNRMPELQATVRRSDNPWQTAIQLAIAGNIIDFGIRGDIDESQVDICLKEAMTADLGTSTVQQFADETKTAKSILYLTDNAGEIVFDQLLLNLLPMDRVTVAVKGKPIINDATLLDAEATGLTKMVKVIDNGDNAPGTVLSQCNETFRKAFDQADMIIAKGQGNYETLSENSRPIWFLLKVKCQVIAKHLGLPMGSLVLKKSSKNL